MIQTPYSTWAPQWSPTEHEIFRDFGFAAFAAQMLESSLVTILLAAEHAGHIKLNKKELESELFLSQKTLGALIKELKRAGFEGELAEMLEDARQARNHLMHHFFIWSSGDYSTEEGRGRILKELQTLRFRIGRVQNACSQINEQVCERTYGFSRSQLESFYRQYQNEKRSEQGSREESPTRSDSTPRDN